MCSRNICTNNYIYTYCYSGDYSGVNSRFAVILFVQIGQIAFKGMKSLNKIQSVVYETAYNSNDNLLVCAPTGAGKTNIAMLTIVNLIKQHMQQGVIKKDEFKVCS